MDSKSVTEEEIEDRVSTFLVRNFPQISMHGGSAMIEGLDLETGEVWLRLGGACSGCGISPLTIEAIRSRLPREIPEISTVHADTGSGFMGSGSATESREGERFPDVPF